MTGFFTTKENVQTVASYEHFAKPKEKFKDNFTGEVSKKENYWFDQSKEKPEKQRKNERMLQHSV